MKTGVCTLSEKDYHYGVGVLTNSLYHHGFRGVVWVGYKGNLPDWTVPTQTTSDYQEFQVAEDCVIRFVKIESYKFLNNYKPDFMLDILNRLQPELEALCYFDPDITNKCVWSTYERWVECGIALCEDGYEHMSLNHPDRVAWRQFSERLGYTLYRHRERTYSAGFLGVTQSHKIFLVLWQDYLEKLQALGYADLRDFHFPHQYPYLIDDQCALNAIISLTELPLSTMDKRAMDFDGSATRNIMSHAAGGTSTKPWRKDYLIKLLLAGEPPSLPDKAYWRHTQTPLQLYSRLYYRWKRIDLLMASALARVVSRPRY